MSENRNGCGCQCNNTPEPIYMDVNRILDSCKDKDCFEDVRVFLTECGQEIIEHCGSVRTKCCKIIGSNISVSSLNFNRGFYQVMIRLYCKCEFECCVSPGRPQIVDGIVVVDKAVILYGGEGGVKTFRSNEGTDSFCTLPVFTSGCDTSLPTAVIEVTDPVVLSAKVIERCNYHCNCCGCPDEMPECVVSSLNGNLCHDDHVQRYLVISLGFFSVVRLEREAQYIVNGLEYSVPEKECVCDDSDDPCSVFRRMAFPVDQFSSHSIPMRRGERFCKGEREEKDDHCRDRDRGDHDRDGGCGCGR